MPSPSCKTIIVASSYGTTLALLFLTPVVIARVWALYGRRRAILGWLLFGLAVVAVSVGVTLNIQAERHIYIKNPAPELISGCLVRFSSTAWVPYVLALLYESIIFGMTLWKTWALKARFGSRTLTSQLLRDGSLYYIVVLVVLTLCSLGTQIEEFKAAALASGFIVAMNSIMCNRMILSMHAFNEETKLCVDMPPATMVSKRGVRNNKSNQTQDLV
ncbi:unnamed protein product [Rhizoctonia solani]|uniref:Uncharacterized protein n=1 Tax=Rhizoctonia solani TaxID=456999 RepID=A0A8H3AHX7_9AGAM|nr:unnamed protein product [Rhizoctonia solani]